MSRVTVSSVVLRILSAVATLRSIASLGANLEEAEWPVSDADHLRTVMTVTRSSPSGWQVVGDARQDCANLARTNVLRTRGRLLALAASAARQWATEDRFRDLAGHDLRLIDGFSYMEVHGDTGE